MRLVIQRVNKASVEVTETGKIAGRIGKGLFVLLGIGEEDNEEDVEKLVEKLLKLRIMADKNDKMNLSITDVKGEILVVSQFTLYADISKGNRPSFVKAAGHDKARDLYRLFISKLVEKGIKVETGSFGKYMKISAELDGPVTILVST
jgi:D-tyrosyl-tRNA(Tyr) deacylase